MLPMTFGTEPLPETGKLRQKLLAALRAAVSVTVTVPLIVVVFEVEFMLGASKHVMVCA